MKIDEKCNAKGHLKSSKIGAAGAEGPDFSDLATVSIFRVTSMVYRLFRRPLVCELYAHGHIILQVLSFSKSLFLTVLMLQFSWF